MRAGVALVAALAALVVAPSGAAASTRACHAPDRHIAHLRASGVSCQYAGYFSKGFALGAEFQRSPYKATYRSFRCTLVLNSGGRSTIRCTRRSARVSFVQTPAR